METPSWDKTKPSGYKMQRRVRDAREVPCGSLLYSVAGRRWRGALTEPGRGPAPASQGSPHCAAWRGSALPRLLEPGHACALARSAFPPRRRWRKWAPPHVRWDRGLGFLAAVLGQESGSKAHQPLPAGHCPQLSPASLMPPGQLHRLWVHSSAILRHSSEEPLVALSRENFPPRIESHCAVCGPSYSGG